MLATVYPYLGKKGKHLGTVGVKGERSFRIKNLCGGDRLKVFVEILTLGEWAPLFSPLFQPYPLSISPRGFHVEPCSGLIRLDNGYRLCSIDRLELLGLSHRVSLSG